jgi:hypothetical protein
MALSKNVIDHHIYDWRTRLKKTSRPYRKRWPSHLFRHEPVDNAAVILSSGNLLSRNHSLNVRPRDIAAEDVIGRRTESHDLVRLYFRPKNPTQYHIEGVKKPHEYYQRDPRFHAPVLVMFVFDIKQIMQGQGVLLSDGNVQSDITKIGDDDWFFKTLDFNQIYHEGPLPNDLTRTEVTRARCAEVLTPSPLPLEATLKYVLCRSSAERETLLHMMSPSARETWQSRIGVVSKPGVFEDRYCYVQTFDGSANSIRYTLKPRNDGQSVWVKVQVKDNMDRPVIRTPEEKLDPSKKWQVRCSLADGLYHASIYLEGCLAYRSVFEVDDLPF